MEMAEASYSLKFVSHVSFQEVLDRRWNNKISPNFSTFKVLNKLGAWVICEPKFAGSREICEFWKNVNLTHVIQVHVIFQYT